MQKKKVVGKEVLTAVPNEEILGDGNPNTCESVYNLILHNQSTDSIHVIINDGTPVLVLSDESISIPDIIVESIVVVEANSSVRLMAIQL